MPSPTSYILRFLSDLRPGIHPEKPFFPVALVLITTYLTLVSTCITRSCLSVPELQSSLLTPQRFLILENGEATQDSRQ
jgi:hypothetical protein